ncbi:MAG: O-methyltransferase [Williamsia sp.]|nr:O-methyltransferase [Williamsia sp.]
MEPIDPLVQSYAARFSSPEDPVLRQIAAETEQSVPHAHMLSGHVQGRFLEMFSRLLRPRRILEIGTFTGYSAICLSRGLQDGGRLHTIENREETAAIARKNFNQAGMEDKITLHVGNAAEIIPALEETWDLVFIDADKPGYIDYYNLVLPWLRTGGVILADNVLFHGQVLEEKVTGKSALAIQAFNEHVKRDSTVDRVLLTIRDGILMIVKK